MLDLSSGGPRADLPDQNPQRGHLDFGTRFLTAKSTSCSRRWIAENIAAPCCLERTTFR